MPISSTLLSLDAVRKDFGATTVLRDVSFAVGGNEFLTLLGPSGSGKTTILRLIGGFETPTAGVIRYAGADISGAPINRRPFNTVFQDYALFPHMSVRQNVGYGLMVRGARKAEIAERVAEVLAVVGLGDLGDRLPAQLSGGQRQRVALARAIICKPRLILLDEPLAALDVALRASMCKFLKDMQRQLDVAFVYVTHDQSEAITLSDRIIVLRGGEIEQVGTPVELYRAPRTHFVAGFFGENNLIAGRVADVSNTGAAVETPLGRIVVEGQGAPAAGTAVTIAIRSEQFQLAPAALERPAFLVRDVQFAGPTIALDLEVEREPRVALRVRLAGAQPVPIVGARTGLTWAADAPVLIAERVAGRG